MQCKWPALQLLFLLAFLACSRLSDVVYAADKSPNILFIAVDDLNDWVNCLGGRDSVHTPNLDRLARRGVLFTNAHCSAPSCNPSRASIMTGVRPSTSGIYNNSQNWRASPVLKDAITIPEFFRSQGYIVYGGGKIFHCLSWIKTGYGKQRNDPDIWDDYFPSKFQPMPEACWPEGMEHRPNGYVYWEPLAQGKTPGRPSHFFDWAPLNAEDRQMADYKVIDWAIEQLNQKHDTPFFYAVGIFRPHIPWFVPRKYFDMYPLDEIKLPQIRPNDLDDCSPVGRKFCRRKWQQWLVGNDMWKGAVRGYLASISFADAQLGRLLDAFDSSPCADNTLIVLWSDHGMHIGEKEHWEKFTLWEESTRVPLIFTGPGIHDHGRACDQPVSLLDVYPTLVELCGYEPFDQLEGVSLVPQLKNRKAVKNTPAITTWGKNNHAVRTRHWRYIRYHNGDEELYDHRIDPEEFTNLADRPQHNALIKRFSGFLPEINADSLEVTPEK